MSEKAIRIMLVDDHEIVRTGLRSLLEKQDSFTVVGEAGTAGEAVAVARQTEPDVIVMDVRLPDGNGVEVCREVRSDRPATRVIMLTSYADDEAVYGSILAGASAYLLKQTRGQALAEAITRVAAGESLLDPAVTDTVLTRMRSLARGEVDELAVLSEQERKVLGYIAEGKTNKEIADDMYLSDKTVKNYVSSILAKLNLRRRSEAAAFIAERRSKGMGRESE